MFKGLFQHPEEPQASVHAAHRTPVADSGKEEPRACTRAAHRTPGTDTHASRPEACTTAGMIAADCRRKIVTLDVLRQIIAQMRRSTRPGEKGRTIVQCHGCFDIVHPGHIRYLKFARTQGDVLVVSITGDAAIEKGDQQPYIPEELRAENLAALEFVDYVIIDPNPTACSLLQAIRPDAYVKGHEYATSKDPRFLAERQVVESYGGRVIFSSGQVVFSSSRLAETMLRPDAFAAQRLNTVCRRHGIDRHSLVGFLNDMRNKRVLVLGDIVVDRYVLCDATAIANESPMMSLSELDKKDCLGGAAVAAMQIAALGARPVLVTGLGNDRQSDGALEVLAKAGVEVRALRHRPSLAMKTRFLVDEHKLFRVDRTPVRPLDSVGERETADILIGEAMHADAAIFYDCGYGMITPGLLQRLGATFRHHVPLISGGSSEPPGSLSSLRYFDLLCTSERKLRVAMNDFGGGLSTLAYRMLEQTQAKQMLVTVGKRGLVTFDRRSHDRQSMAWSDRLCSEYLPSLAAGVVDRLGCGESLATVATLTLACGAGLMQAAYLGLAAAAIQIARLGILSVRSEDLEQWIQHRPELDHTDEDESYPIETDTLCESVY